ncbi:DMT family transporter [Tepidanaerobacter acetatoxydans]|uniref:DMT family transporter n=1 Tax=Tepidanaerobacter acetatoxydans TaxID=499229 RepID=UPI0023F5173E
MNNLKKSTMADIALFFVALGWGLNFVVEKKSLTAITPLMYLGLRFILSALLMAVIFHKQLKNITKEDIKGGLIIGLFVLLGFVTQTVGLVYTTPSKSGFITGSNVVMVPFLAYFITKDFPQLNQIVGAIITFVGLGFVSIDENLVIGWGDILTLLCALCFALQITFTEYYVKKSNPINIAFIQIALTGIITMGIAIIQEPAVSLSYDLEIWGSILFGAVFCTAGAFAVQNVAQKYTSSTHAAVILCTESIFAGIFSYLFWGEPLALKTVVGFVLVLAGVLITEIVPARATECIKESAEITTL